MREPKPMYFNRGVRYVAQGDCSMCHDIELPVVEAYYDNIEKRPKGKQWEEIHHTKVMVGFCADCWASLAACWPADG